MSIIASFAVPHPPLIVKEIGRGSENQILKTIASYKQVAKEIKELEPETIIISSPHTKCYTDYFYLSSTTKVEGSFATFGAPQVEFKEEIDKELVQEIENISKEETFPAGTINEAVELDHGTMVPLYFIRKEYPNCKIIVIGISQLPLDMHYHLGEIITKAVEKLNRKVVYVASGDLSHKLQEYGPYGFIEEGPIYDKRIIKTLQEANFKELLEYDEEFLDKAAECGHPSFTIMAGTWDKRKVKASFLSHEDITGVGYGIWTFYPQEDEYVLLAKQSITSYIKEHKKLKVPNNLSTELLNNQAGVFVSIHKDGYLRGCIGTFLPMQNNIAEEIIENAISASTRDPRFEPITEEELKYLEINVDVLTPPEKINTKEELDPKRYGVIVEKDYRRGLLLPDLEGIDEIDDQINIAKQKAGISKEEEVDLYRFEVVRHK